MKSLTAYFPGMKTRSVLIAGLLTFCALLIHEQAKADATADVQTVTAQRTGFTVMPTGDEASDQIISHAITCMLADSVTRDEAVQIALLNNRTLQVRLADLGIACGDLIEAGLLKNPILEALYRTSSEPDTVANLEWSISLDFINVLTLPLRRKIAASEFEQTKLQVANDVLDLAFDVQVAYYNMQAAIQTGALYRKAIEASKAAYEGARMLHESGNITDLKLHQEQAIYEEQKLLLSEAEVEAVQLREELNLLMGLWGPCTEWKMPGTLPTLPTREFQGRGLESIAVYQRLDLAAARQEIETIGRELGLTNATSLLPELEGTYNAERETDGSWLRGGGVSLPLPIFNQGQGRIQKDRARLAQAQHRYYALAVEVRSEVRKAFSQMRKHRDRVQYYDKIMLPLRKRIVEESHLMFNSMDVSPFELLEAKREEVNAMRERVSAVNEYWEARSELERAMGGSFRCYTCEQVQHSTSVASPAAASAAPNGMSSAETEGARGDHGSGGEADGPSASSGAGQGAEAAGSTGGAS